MRVYCFSNAFYTKHPHTQLTYLSNTGSSLLLLAAGLDSNNPNGMYAGLGLPPIEYGKVITSIFLKVSVSEFLTLFSCRTQEGFFWTVRPGKPLLAAVAISLVISSFLASFWPKGTLDGLPVMGLALGNCPLLPLWIWIYCILWWFVQDLVKVSTLAFLNYFNIFPNRLADMAPFEKGGGRRREREGEERGKREKRE